MVCCCLNIIFLRTQCRHTVGQRAHLDQTHMGKMLIKSSYNRFLCAGFHGKTWDKTHQESAVTDPFRCLSTRCRCFLLLHLCVLLLRSSRSTQTHSQQYHYVTQKCGDGSRMFLNKEQPVNSRAQVRDRPACSPGNAHSYTHKHTHNLCTLNIAVSFQVPQEEGTFLTFLEREGKGRDIKGEGRLTLGPWPHKLHLMLWLPDFFCPGKNIIIKTWRMLKISWNRLELKHLHNNN